MLIPDGELVFEDGDVSMQECLTEQTVAAALISFAVGAFGSVLGRIFFKKAHGRTKFGAAAAESWEWRTPRVALYVRGRGAVGRPSQSRDRKHWTRATRSCFG